MKNLFQFLGEATASQASLQAKKLNLKSDGHGGWLDSKGEFVAKTEGGKLKFYDKGQKPGKDPDKQHAHCLNLATRDLCATHAHSICQTSINFDDNTHCTLHAHKL